MDETTILSALLARIGDPIVLTKDELDAALTLPCFVVNEADGRVITRTNPLGG